MNKFSIFIVCLSLVCLSSCSILEDYFGMDKAMVQAYRDFMAQRHTEETHKGDALEVAYQEYKSTVKLLHLAGAEFISELPIFKGEVVTKEEFGRHVSEKMKIDITAYGGLHVQQFCPRHLNHNMINIGSCDSRSAIAYYSLP